MATLLRLRRRCDACSSRAQCSCYQLLEPRRHGQDWFFEWHASWLCPPCSRPLLDLFSQRVDELAEARSTRGLA